MVTPTNATVSNGVRSIDALMERAPMAPQISPFFVDDALGSWRKEGVVGSSVLWDRREWNVEHNRIYLSSANPQVPNMANTDSSLHSGLTKGATF